MKKTKCYIYTRVSTAIQVDGYSLDAQKDKIRKYAEFQDMEIVGEYSDEGHSGKNIKGRPEFMKMLNDIEDGKDEISFVLVFKLSRFGRNASDVLSALQLMQDYGVNLICVEDGIDSSKEAGKLLISIIAAVAEMERDTIRVQTMAGREQKAKEGGWNGGFAPYGYRLEDNHLYIAEDEVDIIQMIYDRYIHTNDGINGVANYLNNHGYTKKLRQNGTIPGFSASFVKAVLDNPVYAGKIAYGRRRTEKIYGTRNEMHVVEQAEYPVYKGKHEAIISEEDWNLAQEKRKLNSFKREKIHDPNHAHILSGIIKCPCCGKGMYGNIAKAHKKDNKTRYYYYCKNTVNATGHKCTFRLNIEQSQINDVLARIISGMTKEGKLKEAIQAKIGSVADTSDMEKELSVNLANLNQAETIKTRLEKQMDTLDVTDLHYERKINDLQKRLDTQYDIIDEAENAVEEIRSQIRDLRRDQISSESIYEFLLHFDELYSMSSEMERKQFMQTFIDRIDIFPERREDGNWIKNISFKFYVPIVKDGKTTSDIKGITFEKEDNTGEFVPLEKLMTLETVCLLSKLHEAKHHVNVRLDMDELDLTSAESKAAYEEIKAYVAEHNDGMKVSNLYIAQVKAKYGIIERENYNKPKSDDSRQPKCPKEKEEAIVEALKAFKMI